MHCWNFMWGNIENEDDGFVTVVFQYCYIGDVAIRKFFCFFSFIILLSLFYYS
jgi:hypothetical protein